MIKRRIAQALLTAGVLSMPGPVFADHIGDPVYDIYYYSDSTYTVQVGFDEGRCYYFGPGYGHEGQTTEYAVYQYKGHCSGGYWVEIH